MSPPRLLARLAGFFYLITALAGGYAEMGVRAHVIVSNDAATTARNILASPELYRVAFAADIVGCVAYTVVTLLLYELLKPVSRRLSLLAAFFSIVGISVGALAALGHLASLLILNGSAYLTAFDRAQLQAMALLALKLHSQAYLIALVFFGIYEVLLGYLIFNSTFLPRTLGILVAIAGLAFLTNSFALFLSPVLGNALNTTMLALDGIGEISLTLWLLVFGVNSEKWRARAYVASAS